MFLTWISHARKGRAPRTAGGADVVGQHLVLGGDGLTAHDPNVTTFEAAGLVTVLDGQMIDVPIVERARRNLGSG